MTTTFFSADFHFGDKFVSELRGFDSTQEHDESIIDMWNKQVTKRDTVYILGDLTLGGSRKWEYALDLVGKLPAENKHLILGNHDIASPLFGSKSRKWFKEFTKVFDTVRDYDILTWNKQKILLSHYPYQDRGEGDRDMEERYTQFRLPDLGEWLLHGHTHSGSMISNHPKSLHVGWDVERRLFNVEELKEIVDGY